MMKKRQLAASADVTAGRVHTSLSTDNLAMQPRGKMGITGLELEESIASDVPQTRISGRPASQGSALSTAPKGPNKNLTSRGSGKGLADISGDMRSSRAASRSEFRLDKNFALNFVFDLDGIIIPEKILYDDYSATKPAAKVNLSGWIVNKGLFRSLQEKCKGAVQELSLEDCVGLTVSMLETVRGAPKLRMLNVSHSGIELTFQAAQILGSLSRLVDLNISGCRVDISSFSILCNTCQALKSLTCQACPGLDDYCCQALAACMQRFRRLQCIDLSRGIDYGDEGYITVLGATPKLLTKLNMSNTTVLSSLAITSLRQKMPALTYLDMSEMKLGQSCFEWLTEGCVNLETLILTRCENLDDIAITNMGSKLHRLQKIVFSHCTKLTNEGVTKFFDQLAASLELKLGKGLRHVDISSNILLGGLPVQALAAYEKKAQSINGQGLTEIRMNGLSMVTAPALMSLWENCLNIKKFIMAIETSTTVTHRRSVMPHISDEILVHVQYSSLEEVNLSGCCLITDVGICSLIEKCCKQLKHVDVSYCGNITDISMYHLAQYAGKSLRELNITGCNKVTNHGIIALCTDHSNTRRKQKLIDNILAQETYNGQSQDKYIAYSSKIGEFADDENVPDSDALCGVGEEHSSSPASVTLNMSKRRFNNIEQILNPFPHSAGCLWLHELKLNGCFKVTDPGVVAMCNLKSLRSLAIRNLDNVTDSPLLLLAESCTKLTSLDISSLDMVSINVVHAFAKHCYQLETLNCDLCNFTTGDFSAATRTKLPLGMPNGLRSKLEPRPRPILEYNRFVVQTRECRFAAWVLTKFAIYVIAWGRLRRCKTARRSAIQTIKRVYYDFLNRRRLQHLRGNKNQKTRCANILQKWAKRCLGSKAQGWQKRDAKRRQAMTLLIQRIFRGHRARKRMRNKFRRLFYFYTLIGHMAHKYWVLHHARIFHKKLLQVQSIGRMFPVKLQYILTRRSVVTFQIHIKNYLKRKRDCRAAIARIMFALDGENEAANVIRKNWRIRMFNKTMSSFIFVCAIYWRTLDDEKDWRTVQLQAWWRGSRVRLVNWRVREIPRIIYRAAAKIQALWHRYKVRCWYLPYKAKLKKQMACWRHCLASCCRLRLGAILRKIQKQYKWRYFNRQRLRAAICVQRYYSGFRVRKSNAMRAYEIASKWARKIQRQLKLYRGRVFRKRLMAIRHMAVWRIQRHIHKLFDGEAMKRIQSKQMARRRKEILEEKARLLLVMRRHAVEKRKSEFIFIFARRIQKCFRKYSTRKRKKREAMENRAKAAEEATEDLKAIKNNRLLVSLLRPVAGLVRQVGQTIKALGGASEFASKADKPRLTNAILKYHTRSIVQVGITSLHMTVGEAERKAFEMGQDSMRTSGKPFYECLVEDISGSIRLKVFLWVMRGKGSDCFTALTVGSKPKDASTSQLKSRAIGASVNFKKIIWHQHLAFELCAALTIKAGQGGFAISDLRVVYTEDECDDLEVKGYIRVGDMTQYGFGSYIYTFSRTPENQDDIFRLGMVEKQVWCDARLLKVIYTYNLANSDVYAIRNVFEEILGDSISESIRVKDVFAAFGLPEMTQIATWMVEAIKPKRKNEIIFSEYVHMVVAVCMFGTRDLMRFLFGCMDAKQNAYLKRDQFVELINHMTAGNQNPLLWIMQYDNFKDRKLDSIFYAGFEAFCNQYRAVLWGAERLVLDIRNKNLGDAHWSDKLAHFAAQRKELGVILV